MTHKFGKNQLLWLRDMTSLVAGGQAILKKNACYFPFLGEKCKQCQQKAAKCSIMTYSTSPASKIFNFERIIF